MYFFILKMKCLFNLLTEFKIKKIYINLHILIFIIFANVWHFLIVILSKEQIQETESPIKQVRKPGAPLHCFLTRFRI